MTQNNLDQLCAKYGQEIPGSKNDETLIQKSLGVLQEDGLFAFVIFLESKKDEKIAKKILEKVAELLNESELTKNDSGNNLRKKILEITKDLNKIFLTKDLIGRTLIYARYHAKALGDGK